MRREQAEADDGDLDEGPVCSICYASRPEVVHQPCGHSEFCLVCSLQCDVCPLCRTEISDRDELAAKGAATVPAGQALSGGVASAASPPATAGAGLRDEVALSTAATVASTSSHVYNGDDDWTDTEENGGGSPTDAGGNDDGERATVALAPQPPVETADEQAPAPASQNEAQVTPQLDEGEGKDEGEDKDEEDDDMDL
jgi:hypothetical protein